MRIVPVEIYSDLTNAAVMRHPNRRFPGLLIQGDTLSTLLTAIDRVCKDAAPSSSAFEEADELRTTVQAWLDHYNEVLIEHGIEVPCSGPLPD